MARQTGGRRGAQVRVGAVREGDVVRLGYRVVEVAHLAAGGTRRGESRGALPGVVTRPAGLARIARVARMAGYAGGVGRRAGIVAGAGRGAVVRPRFEGLRRCRGDRQRAGHGGTGQRRHDDTHFQRVTQPDPDRRPWQAAPWQRCGPTSVVHVSQTNVLPGLPSQAHRGRTPCRCHAVSWILYHPGYTETRGVSHPPARRIPAKPLPGPHPLSLDRPAPPPRIGPSTEPRPVHTEPPVKQPAGR